MNIFKLIYFPDTLSILVFVLLFMVIILAIYSMNKIKTISVLYKEKKRLTNIVNELDHQAKLIIKGDMELKLYQEEVEDKLNKLTLLKNLILSSLNILDKERLFEQVDEKTINNLGFKKGALIGFNDLESKINVGYDVKEIEAIKLFLQHKKNIFLSTALVSSDYEICKTLAASLQAHDFLMAPIKARENIYTIFIVSNLVIPSDIKRAEKEIFSIICMYLGQCLDNIKLFEDIYHAKDELEKKVKERTNELVKSLREIEIMNRSKSDFISGVSHELRTPLTSIKGFSSLLVEEKFGKLPEEARKRLTTIDENVNKLVEMVNTLLDIARIESGKTEVKIAPADLVEVVKAALDLLSWQIQSKGIKLVLDVPQELIAYMDKNLIERVFINLINNAVKFTPQGGQIKVGCKKENNIILVAISDTGCGIEEENLENVFKEFFRVDNSINKEAKGTGLGLSLVKKIIETHKEKIWAESKVGKGTTFYFTLKSGKNA